MKSRLYLRHVTRHDETQDGWRQEDERSALEPPDGAVLCCYPWLQNTKHHSILHTGTRYEFQDQLRITAQFTRYI